MLLQAVGRQEMQMAPQELRTFFVTALTWGRRPIFLAEPMALLFLDTLRNHRIHHHISSP